MGKKRIALVLYTSGLEYDDRIRKEILSITKHCPEISFEIFAVVPENKEEEGITDYGVKYHIPYLKSREKYPSGTHTIAKAYDFYRSVAPRLKEFDAVWCADIETFLFISLLPKDKPLIWDLHELPSKFMGNNILRKVFKHFTKKCAVMYHANQSRIDCLKKLSMLPASVPQVAIRNYPNVSLREEQTPDFDKLNDFKKWRNDRKCIYLQGVNAMDRYPVESISAIVESDYCGVVVGGMHDESYKILTKKYSDRLLNEKLFFAGRVPQIQTKNFIAECRFGLVFYATNSLNNTYCEPNRMFQTIMMGRPIVVGNNPPMRELVERFNAGIVLKSDGSDIEEIKQAIKEIDNNYDFYQSNTNSAKDSITWESQEKLLISSIKKALNIN